MARPYQMSALLVVHCCLVFETDLDYDPDESVSALALDVIDELRMKMLECLLVLQTLPEEADLNLSDLAGDILAAHRGTQEAYHAASIVHQGAELDARWGITCRAPRPSSPATMPRCAAVRPKCCRWRRCVTGSNGTCISCPAPIAPRT